MSVTLTELFPIRKTRSSSKLISTEVNKLISLRTRNATRSYDNAEEVSIKAHSRQHFNAILELPKPQVTLDSKPKGRFVQKTGSRSCSKFLTSASPVKHAKDRCSPRKNLSTIFDNLPISNNNKSEVKTYRELESTISPSKNVSPKKMPKKLFTTPKKDQENCAPSPSMEVISPSSPRNLFDSPRKLFASPTRDQGNNLTSPNRTPKRHSTELLRLAVTSPPKRKKNYAEANKNFTPISLFKQNVSCYHAAKEALHSSTPSRLVSRERQIKDLRDFLEEHLDSEKKPGCLYISGAPGTGKSACLAQLLEELKVEYNFDSIFINCMTIRHSGAVFEKIISSLNAKIGGSIKETIKLIESKICRRKQMLVLVLDEMDQLSTKNQQVLYSIFEWPRLPSSKLVLIGIANSLDMTDRILPRLHACGCQPMLLHFPPYSQAQITAILQDRLKDLAAGENCIIKPAALQLCARKIAAQTGDIRKALDTCRRAIELVEKSVRSQQVLRPTSDDGTNPGSPRRSPRKLSLQPVELSHIMDVLHEIYGSRVVSSSASQSETGSGMPIQQKLLLCTLLLLTRHKFKGRDLTFGKLHEVYCKVCHVHKVEELADVDFHSVCLLAEGNGMVQIKKHKEIRQSKIVLKVDEDELQFIMKDKSLLAAILEDPSLLK